MTETNTIHHIIRNDDYKSFMKLVLPEDYRKYLPYALFHNAKYIAERISLNLLPSDYNQILINYYAERDDLEELEDIFRRSDEKYNLCNAVNSLFDKLEICWKEVCYEGICHNNIHIPHSLNFIIEKATDDELLPPLYEAFMKCIPEFKGESLYNYRRLWGLVWSFASNRSIDFNSYERDHNNSLLAYAVENAIVTGDWEFVREVKNKGFSPNQKDYRGKTALQLLEEETIVEIYKELL